MPVDPTEAFQIFRSAYRNGVLQKFMQLQGSAIKLAIDESGADLGDVLNRMDEAAESTVFDIDRLFGKLFDLAKYLNLKSDAAMSLAYRLVNLPAVERVVVRGFADAMKRSLARKPAPSLKERISPLSAAFRKNP